MRLKLKNIAGGIAVMTLSMTAFFSLPAPARNHLVLFEKFTNTGCQPCAVFAPMADSLLDARMGEVVEIAYHGNTPFPNDEFYLPVKEQVAPRISCYNVYAYPTVRLDGTNSSLSIEEISKWIDIEAAKESQLDFDLSSMQEDGVLKVNVTLGTDQDIRYTDTRLFVAALEAEVTPERPAMNGQKVFHNEFRQFLTSPEGEPVSLGSEPMEWSGEWTIERMADNEELAVVAWVQDMATKRVIETAYLPRAPKSAADARILRVTDTPDMVCDPLFSGRLWLRNMGHDDLTRCEIAIDIDGETHTFPWEGNLPYLSTEEVAIPPFSDFDYDPDLSVSTVGITPIKLNGTDAEGEGVSIALPHSPAGQNRFKLLISTDNKPEEISWRMVNSRGEQICKSEPYTERRHNYEIELPLTEDGCYTIEFSDAGNNGISGSFGNGFYRLYDWQDGGYHEMLQNTYKGSGHKLLFKAENVVTNHIYLYSATTASENIVFHGDTRVLFFPKAGGVTIHDSEGRLLFVSEVKEGDSLSVNDLESGVYVVSCNSGDGRQSITIRL